MICIAYISLEKHFFAPLFVRVLAGKECLSTSVFASIFSTTHQPIYHLPTIYPSTHHQPIYPPSTHHLPTIKPSTHHQTIYPPSTHYPQSTHHLPTIYHLPTINPLSTLHSRLPLIKILSPVSMTQLHMATIKTTEKQFLV